MIGLVRMSTNCVRGTGKGVGFTMSQVSAAPKSLDCYWAHADGALRAPNTSKGRKTVDARRSQRG